MKPIASQLRASLPTVPARRHRPRQSPARPGTLRELFAGLTESGRWWLIPMVAVLGLTAVLLVVVSAVEYVAPFVYTIF
jgi:hypothetical protein